jgi:hypothetical protein
MTSESVLSPSSDGNRSCFKRMTLHLTYVPNMVVRDRLDQWENAVRRDAQLGPGDWRMLALWPAARDAAVSGSTGIEGNPLDPAAVEEVLAGAAVEADTDHIREVENYNRALNLARDATARPGFTWSQEVIHLINATVMEGLPPDTPRQLPRAGRGCLRGDLHRAKSAGGAVPHGRAR